jgi:phenol/toluene 2-monooxygenase (NADH) P0/A0
MSDEALIDYEWRAIRIAEVREDGFVAFDFYVGDPDIYAEMVLPTAAFHEFCATQGVEPTGPNELLSHTDGLGLSVRDAIANATRDLRSNYKEAPMRGNNHAA